MQELFDVFDETLDTFRPANFHIGMDEDGAQDMDGNEHRKVEVHKQVVLDCYEFLRRRGVRMLVWNDGFDQIRKYGEEIPRDIVLLPWYYGGGDFTNMKVYTDMGFRILCSPWSQWHVENDQFYSICAASFKSEKVLGMAGTVWYPIAGGPDDDYPRCLVKAAMAFWSPLKADAYPNDKSYYAPAYAGLPGDTLSTRQPVVIPAPEIPGLVSLVTGPGSDHFACEAARERLVSGGTASVAPVLEAMAKSPDTISPWGEGTIRRIVRDPVGDPAPMVKALETAAGSSGALRALALEMLGSLGDSAFVEKLDASDSDVARAMGAGKDKRYVPALVKAASSSGPAQVEALTALGKLKSLDELISLKSGWKSFDDKAREAYARSVAMQASETAIPLLDELAGDANWRVRFRAAIGLGATRSEKAGQAILKILDDKNPSVFRVALWWCTDTFILKPERYFPKIMSRLTVTEDRDIVRAVVHAVLLMRHPQVGQWLAKGEDPAKRMDYAKLTVWKDKSTIDGLNRMVAYPDPKLAMDGVAALLKNGSGLNADAVVKALDKFSIEDKRWFCIKMREDGAPEAIPVLRKLWDTNDHLVQTFIIQYAGRVPVQDAFDLLYEVYPKIPATDEGLRMGAIGSMAAHVNGMDAKARKTIPLILGIYEKAGLNEKVAFDNTLCRASGKEPLKTWDTESAWWAKRLAEWKDWWAKQQK